MIQTDQDPILKKSLIQRQANRHPWERNHHPGLREVRWPLFLCHGLAFQVFSIKLEFYKLDFLGLPAFWFLFCFDVYFFVELGIEPRVLPS